LNRIIAHHDEHHDYRQAADLQRQLVVLSATVHGDISKTFMDDKFLLAVYYWKSDQPNLAQPVLEDLLRTIKSVHGENHVV
jgi:hypothetical protein